MLGRSKLMMVLFLKISLSANVTEYGLGLLLCAHPVWLKAVQCHHNYIICEMSGKGGPDIGGGGVAVSCSVNTDVIRMSVFAVVSLCDYFLVLFKQCNTTIIFPLTFNKSP